MSETRMLLMPTSGRLILHVLAAFLLAVLVPSAQAKELQPMPNWTALAAKPEALMEGFFRWYLQCGDADPRFSFFDVPQEVRRQVLTPQFMSRLGSAEWSLDPFIRTVEHDRDWTETLSVRRFSTGEGSVSVLIAVGTPPETEHILIARLKLESTGKIWRIDQVEEIDRNVRARLFNQLRVGEGTP
ncbi:MAG TPA: hypothetical protein VED40_00760 [Azospirillaceae bacterium]|nr:hypothetical protein [Azospirillaceae bacterium]